MCLFAAVHCMQWFSGLGEVGVEQPHPRFIKGTKEHNFVRVAAGASHSLALTSSGQVWSFGQGSFGTLGALMYTAHLLSVAGAFHACLGFLAGPMLTVCIWVDLTKSTL